MLSIRKILVPVLHADESRVIAGQAAWFARRFDAKVILLHVVGDSNPVENEMEWPELESIAPLRVIRYGDPAGEIETAARELDADLVMLSTVGHGFLHRLISGSATAQILRDVACPIWTGGHPTDMILSNGGEHRFSIHRILCSVDLSPDSAYTVQMAASLAATVNGQLTLVHITTGVEAFGPGGSYVDADWKTGIVGAARAEIAVLQGELGIEADVIVESGNVPELLNMAADKVGADVLVIGHTLGRSHLGDNGNGYGIIRHSRVPVLSV